MYDIERREEILAILQETKHISVTELAARLYTSPSTIRRDLARLETEGLLRRTHGGALSCGDYQNQVPLAVREAEHIEAKRRIAAKAAALIRDGDTVFLDASTTTGCLVAELGRFHDLTVLTNSPKTSMALAAIDCRSYCTGGELLSGSVAYVGLMAASAFRGMRADICFFSARGLSDDGEIGDSSPEECFIKRVMLEQTARRVFLCVQEKRGRRYAHIVCRLDEVDDVILDD
ncbi:MAG: DeoR/GlpR transcriptional regulator [Clostridia bacterium]|nr:DeoR/GlpR transcriptional regulator [Clostridia bacterium]